MKTSKFLLAIVILFSMSALAMAQNTGAKKGVTVTNSGAGVKSSTGSGATVKKGEAKVTTTSGGGSTVNNKGAVAKNKNGGGVEAKKGEVSAKSSSGKGLEINKKGLQIKSKTVNVKLGK